MGPEPRSPQSNIVRDHPLKFMAFSVLFGLSAGAGGELVGLVIAVGLFIYSFSGWTTEGESVIRPTPHRFDIKELAPERQLSLHVEYLPKTGTPPTGLVVTRASDGRTLGYMDVEQVRETLARFDAMEREYDPGPAQVQKEKA